MTEDEIQKNSSEHADFRVSILELQRALYGDEKNGDIGMVAKMDAVYSAFTGIMFLGKIATWLAIVFAGLGGAWAGMIHFFKTK